MINSLCGGSRLTHVTYVSDSVLLMCAVYTVHLIAFSEIIAFIERKCITVATWIYFLKQRQELTCTLNRGKQIKRVLN